jgi:hypothetical protein
VRFEAFLVFPGLRIGPVHAFGNAIDAVRAVERAARKSRAATRAVVACRPFPVYTLESSGGTWIEGTNNLADYVGR